MQGSEKKTGGFVGLRSQPRSHEKVMVSRLAYRRNYMETAWKQIKLNTSHSSVGKKYLLLDDYYGRHSFHS